MYSRYVVGGRDRLNLFGRDGDACFHGARADDVVDVGGGEVSPRGIGILDLYLVADEVMAQATEIEIVLVDVPKGSFLLVRLFS